MIAATRGGALHKEILKCEFSVRHIQKIWAAQRGGVLKQCRGSINLEGYSFGVYVGGGSLQTRVGTTNRQAFPSAPQGFTEGAGIEQRVKGSPVFLNALMSFFFGKKRVQRNVQSYHRTMTDGTMTDER